MPAKGTKKKNPTGKQPRKPVDVPLEVYDRLEKIARQRGFVNPRNGQGNRSKLIEEMLAMYEEDDWLNPGEDDGDREPCELTSQRLRYRQIEGDDVDTIWPCSAPPTLQKPQKYTEFWVNVSRNDYYGLTKEGAIALIPRSEWLTEEEYKVWLQGQHLANSSLKENLPC